MRRPRTYALTLANDLAEAACDKQLTKPIHRYGRVDLLWLPTGDGRPEPPGRTEQDPAPRACGREFALLNQILVIAEAYRILNILNHL